MSSRVLLVSAAALLAVACAGKPPQPPPPEPMVVKDPPAEAPAKPGQGNGRYRVSVASLRTAELTAPWVQHLEGAGYRVTVEAAEVEGTTWHRVILPGYTREGALAILPILEQEGMPRAWIVSRRLSQQAAAPAPAPAAAAEGESANGEATTPAN